MLSSAASPFKPRMHFAKIVNDIFIASTTEVVENISDLYHNLLKLPHLSTALLLMGLLVKCLSAGRLSHQYRL